MYYSVFLVGVLVLLYLPIAYIVLHILRIQYNLHCRRYKGIVCLTFDDGPDPDATPAILRVLNANGIHSTFFVLGTNVKEHPELITAMQRDGHEIGEHGYSHLHPWKSLPWEYIHDLIAGHKALNRLLDSSGHSIYRPTYGKGNALTLMYAWLSRKQLSFWNVDPHDYIMKSAPDIVKSVLDQILKNEGSSVVLLHDGRTGNLERSDCIATAVDTICKVLVKKGYQFKTVSELFASVPE